MFSGLDFYARGELFTLEPLTNGENLRYNNIVNHLDKRNFNYEKKKQLDKKTRLMFVRMLGVLIRFYTSDGCDGTRIGKRTYFH